MEIRGVQVLKVLGEPVRFLTVMVVVTALLGGCAPASIQNGPTVRQRLLPDGEPRLVGGIDSTREVVVQRWDLASEDELQRWTPERIDDEWRFTGRGVFLRTSSTDPSMTRACDVEAARVSAIRVEHSGLTSGAWAQLFWARDGEEFSEERSVVASVKDPSGDLMVTYTFEVAEHPMWSGHITRIRLDPTSQAERRVEIFGVSLLDRPVDEERLRRALEQPWLVDLDGDVRPAVLTVPGQPHRLEVQVPAHAKLRFATGFSGETTAGLRPTVQVDGREIGLEPAVDSPGSPAGIRRWTDREVDLSPWAGRRVAIDLDVVVEGPWSPRDGFPSWAGLELVAPGDSSRRRPNLVVVVLDTLRPDRMSVYGCERDTTPRLKEWSSERAVVFDEVVAPAPWTLPSHVSLFTGQDTLTHGVNTGDPVPAALDLLAERLQRAGYETRAFTGGGYLAADFGLMSGFDRLSYWARPKSDPSAAGDDLQSGLSQALAWLDMGPQRPFFMFFHTYEVHSPYRQREPYFGEMGGRERPDLVPPVNTKPIPPTGVNGLQIIASFVAQKTGTSEVELLDQPDELAWVRDLYDSTVAQADAAIGTLLERLRSLGLEDDTVVVITSDHGESLGEGGIAGHSSLQECEIMVPLLVAGPGLEGARGRRVGTQVRLVDILPTLEELLGLEAAQDTDGVSLVRLARGEVDTHPEDAWVYASSSNFGLALRRRGLLKYVYCNTPWPPTGGGESLTALAGRDSSRGGVASGDQPVEAFRELARDTYYSKAVGAHVEMTNQRSRPLTVVLKGRIAEPLRIKVFDPEGLEIDGRGAQLKLTVPGGTSYRVGLEGEPTGDLFVSARFDDLPAGRREAREVLRLERLATPWAVRWSPDRGWFDGDRSLSGTGVSVEVVGLDRTDDAASEIDPATRDALRQLGYLQ